MTPFWQSFLATMSAIATFCAAVWVITRSNRRK